MSIATFAVPGILAPFQVFFHWLVTDAIPVVRPSLKTKPGHLQKQPHAANSVASINRNGRAQAKIVCGRAAPALRPLGACKAAPPSRKPVSAVRMVRVVEAGQAPASAGRMVISGRMADVCAELDRLAAREAARH